MSTGIPQAIPKRVRKKVKTTRGESGAVRLSIFRFCLGFSDGGQIVGSNGFAILTIRKKWFS